MNNFINNNNKIHILHKLNFLICSDKRQNVDGELNQWFAKTHLRHKGAIMLSSETCQDFR